MCNAIFRVRKQGTLLARLDAFKVYWLFLDRRYESPPLAQKSWLHSGRRMWHFDQRSCLSGQAGLFVILRTETTPILLDKPIEIRDHSGASIHFPI